MITTHFRKAAGALIVYDITNRASFEAVIYWVNLFKEAAGVNVSVLLVGNKLDLVESGALPRQVDQFEAQQLSAQISGDANNAIECSALEGANVEDAFFNLMEDIYKVKEEVPESTPRDHLLIFKETKNTEAGCCC